jgi:hypothetical protein
LRLTAGKGSKRSSTNRDKIVSRSATDGGYIEMIERTLGFVAAGLLQAHHSPVGVYDMKGKKELSGQ